MNIISDKQMFCKKTKYILKIKSKLICKQYIIAYYSLEQEGHFNIFTNSGEHIENKGYIPHNF